LERTEPFIGEGRPLFRAVCRLDLEGVIAKRREDPYGPIVRVRQCGSIPMAASSHGDVREQVRQSQSSRLTEQVCAAVVRNNPPWPDRQDRVHGKAARIATSSLLTLLQRLAIPEGRSGTVGAMELPWKPIVLYGEGEAFGLRIFADVF